MGLLAKYVALLQWICILLFLYIHPPARKQFTRPGLYLAILVSFLAFIPIVVWNQQHNWITLTHLNERSGLHEPWRFRPNFLTDFLGAELGLLNPIFVILTIYAIAKLWKNRTPIQTFLLGMGAPLFLGYLAYTIRARVQPNWIAPAILPLFALAAIHWENLWPAVRSWLRPTLRWGFAFGIVLVVFLHDTNLTDKIFGFWLPAKIDPLTRVRAWSTMTKLVQEERQKANADFIIGAHYGITSLLTFYTPEARRVAANNNLIYTVATERPVNQYYFWPNYLARSGQTALLVQRAGGDPAPELRRQFETIEDLGIRHIEYRGRTLHSIQLYACRNLLPQTAPSERRR
jgi:hypothetical protein